MKTKFIKFLLILMILPLVGIFFNLNSAEASHSGFRFQWGDSENSFIRQTVKSTGSEAINYTYIGNGCLVNYQGTVTGTGGSMTCSGGGFPMEFFGYKPASGNHYFIRVLSKGSETGVKISISSLGNTTVHEIKSPNQIFKYAKPGDGTVTPGADNDGDGQQDPGTDNTGSGTNGAGSNTGTKDTVKAPVPDDKINKSSFFSRIFPECDGREKPLNCWTRRAFSFASVAGGSAAIVAIIVGGVYYITSGGNPDRVGKGKKIIFNALMGVALIILANWFFNSVLGVTNWGY